MYYSKIHGHFNFEFLYEEAVNKFDSGSSFVEIGAFLGKSTCYLAEKVAESGKDIKLNIVDNWVGHPSDAGLAKEIDALGDIYTIFRKNMTDAGVIDSLDTYRGDSADTAVLFDDVSIDFVFIDAAHDYDSVKRDINAWHPKVKASGIIAGHDYGNEETDVKKAVDEIFGSNIRLVDNIWIHYNGDIQHA